jgi:hypothetical protein
MNNWFFLLFIFVLIIRKGPAKPLQSLGSGGVLTVF